MSEYLPEKVECNGEHFKIFISKAEINSRIASLGNQLAKDYKEKNPIFIGVLNGAFMFLADLMRYVSIPCEVDFLKLSSYGDQKISSGDVKDLKNVDAKINGRHIILVEDIVDTGLSLKYMREKIHAMNPASLKVISLLHKKEATIHTVTIDYVGFEIPNKFVLGYGLDYAQEGRNLGQIYIIEEE